jgi:hypothetical protein
MCGWLKYYDEQEAWNRSVKANKEFVKGELTDRELEIMFQSARKYPSQGKQTKVNEQISQIEKEDEIFRHNNKIIFLQEALFHSSEVDYLTIKENDMLRKKHGFDRDQSLLKAKNYVTEKNTSAGLPLQNIKNSTNITYNNALQTIKNSKVSWAGFGKGAARLGFRGLVLAGKSYATFSVATGMLQAASFIATPVIQSIVSNTEQALRQFRNMSQVEMGGQLPLAYLSRGAATERQRAIEAISKAQINGRSVFGNEAANL